MKTKCPIYMAAELALVIVSAFPFASLSAADPEKPPVYTLQCDMVPVKDVIVQGGPGFKIVGSNPPAMQSFELHALISWSMPQLDEAGRELVFSGAILNVYLVKTAPAVQVDPPHVARAPELHGAPVAHRYGWSPLHPVPVVTTISVDDPQSKQITVRHNIGEKRVGAGNGFSLETTAVDSDNQHGFEFMVTFDGSFTLDGVEYEANGKYGGNTDIEFGVKTQQGKSALVPEDHRRGQ